MVLAPGPNAEAARKKTGKKRGWRRRARPGGGAPEHPARPHPARPPQHHEDFSRNWKALRELLKQKPQASEKPMGVSQTTPQVIQPKNTPARIKKEETQSQGPEREADKRKGPIQLEEKGSKKRAHGDPALKSTYPGPKKQKGPVAPAPPRNPTEEDLWFDDVDLADIETTLGPEAGRIIRQRMGRRKVAMTLEKEQAFTGLTKALALDCEMVGVGPGGEESVAARVSLVNQFGKCVYDKYVKVKQPVTDYRTAISGVRPQHLLQGEDFEVVQKEVADMLKGRVLVGHALHNDLKVLFLDHPKRKVRDTQKYKPFKTQAKSGRPSLKLLAERILGVQIQQAEHCSVQDAQIAMRLYITVRKEWEKAQNRRSL
ncbi:RNA exonuclease 4 [Suncus etruscus]|uniref:RNA exonuclease 4 n=1 Tax=Suncus etruscus TaxID=109475 RepID=UPI00210FC37A|nr:RNA exonuclease 4 [Suncus etruscus]